MTAGDRRNGMRPVIEFCHAKGRPMKKMLWMFLIIALSASAQVQSKMEVRAQAEEQLKKMTPQEIDAKIKDVGMSRTEAESKARELGIDLNSYLNGYVSPGTPVPSPDMTPVATTVVKPATEETQQASQPEIKKIEPTSVPDLGLFGQAFFKKENANFDPSPSFSEKDYVVGSGDVLRITMWGTTELTFEATVDKEGRIIVPTVGPIFLAGFQFDEAKKKIQFSMSKSYAGLSDSPPKIFLDVSLSKLRPIRVFMMGEVENPGGYFVNNFGSVFNSLHAVGGPKPSGSMRDIRVMRNGKVLAKVDLYDYLIGTGKTNDVRVNENDIIMVPLRGRTAEIRGAVLRAIKFELLPGEQLRKLIDFSGGLKSSFYTDRIQIDRVIPIAERVKGGPERRLLDIEFTEIAKGNKDYPLEDGDIVTIFPIQSIRTNVVEIQGEVMRPGPFQLEKISTVRDLINAADGLTASAYMKRAELTRIVENYRQEKLPLDLEKVMANDPAHNLKLQPMDVLRVLSIDGVLGGPNNVILEGQAKNPGIFPLFVGLTLSEFVRQNVGLSDSLFRKSVFLKRADLIRKNPDGVSSRIIRFDLWELFEYGIGDTLMLPSDKLLIYSAESIRNNVRTVQIFGNVKQTGQFELSDGMSLVDLLLQAGGYTENAWAIQAEVTRKGNLTLREDSLVHVTFAELPDLFDTSRSSLDILNSSPAKRFILRDGDKIFVRPNPDFYAPRAVFVLGQVKYSGPYMLVRRNERLSDLIARAGGITNDGFARGIKVVRENVTLRLNAENALDDPEGKDDIILQAADRIYVPFKPNTVSVTGEVQNPGVYGFIDGEDADFYLNRAGGLTDSSDIILVTYPEGYVIRSNHGFFSSSIGIPDGSTILVTKLPPPPPPDPVNPNAKTFFESWMDVIALLSSTLTILVLAKNL